MKVIKHIIDISMTAVLLLLMAFQVTEQLAHEWLGIVMTTLVIMHQILNRRWYGALFKGRHRALRSLQTAVNLLLLLSFALSAVSGMLMSSYAVPFLSGIMSAAVARAIHLCASHWSFLLMGLHAGLHFGVIGAKIHNKICKAVVGVLLLIVAGYGIYLFLSQNYGSYLFMTSSFAFFDYTKPAIQVVAENMAMLLGFGTLSYGISLLLKPKKKR